MASSLLTVPPPEISLAMPRELAPHREVPSSRAWNPDFPPRELSPYAHSSTRGNASFAADRNPNAGPGTEPDPQDWEAWQSFASRRLRALPDESAASCLARPSRPA